MKKLLSTAMLAILLSVCFIGCSSDEENESNNGQTTVVTCYSDVDGQKDVYKFCRAMYEPTDGGEIYLQFSDVDLTKYHSIDEIDENMMWQHADLYISSTENVLPVGEIHSDKYDIEIDRRHRVLDFGDNLTGSYQQWYTLATSIHVSDVTSSLYIEKTGNNYYKIRIDNADFLASDGDDGIGPNNRKTTGSFYFEGSVNELERIGFESE